MENKEPTIYERLSKIQQELVAKKTQRNTFGNYNYRSCEDILEAVKHRLRIHGGIIRVSDEIINIGNRYYVRAKADYILGDKIIDAVGFARESEEKKGMDAAQITGAASSYARKYALCGLLCIDDGNDADKTNKHGKDDDIPQKKEPVYALEKKHIDAIKNCPDTGTLTAVCGDIKKELGDKYYPAIVKAYNIRKQEIINAAKSEGN